MRKFLAHVSCFSLVITMANATAIATTTSNFVRLDNNANFTVGLGNMGNYYVSLFGVDFSYLNKSNNIWLDFKTNGSTNYQLTNNGPSLTYTGFDIAGKLGYSIFLRNDLNIIPYFLFDYNSSTMVLSNNSQSMFNYDFSNTALGVGIKPEYLLFDNFKIAVDTNIYYEKQTQILPNGSTQSHFNNNNSYLTITPSIQYNPISNVNLGIFYQLPISLTNNQSNYNVTNQGIASSSFINGFQSPYSYVSLSVGILY